MILGFDAYRAVERRTGVGRNIEYLLSSWTRQSNLPFKQVRVFSPAPLQDAPNDPRFSFEIFPARGPGIWWQTSRLARMAGEVDVLFGFYALPPTYRGRSVVANLGIYEGSYAFPGWRARMSSWHFALSARKADAVIVNAPVTKGDLVRHYNIDPAKIRIIWPGADERFRPERQDESESTGQLVEQLLGERAPYFLFVGKLSLRRNVPALLEAFARVAADRPKLRLLLVGPNTADVPLEDTVRGLGLTHAVRHVQHLDQDTLAVLYRGARAFLMPTTREGFSHPILEAMGSGCPVMTLKHAALGVLEYLDEVVEGGAAEVVVEATDARPNSLADALQRLADDDELCAKLGRLGVRYAGTFPSWEEHARSVMDVLAEVANNGRNGPRPLG